MVQWSIEIRLLVQFLSLFVPSIIAVGGSLWIYHCRRKNKREALKTAILTEIESAKRLSETGSHMHSSDSLPYSRVIPTSIYESHSFELGLLDEKERKPVVDYYSNAMIFNDMVITAKEFKVNGEELPQEDFHYMKRQIDKVRGLRKSALIHLGSDNTSENTDFD